MRSYRIILAGGGTGGHIFPLVAVARELKKKADEKGLNLKLLAVAEDNIWRNEFEKEGINFKRIFALKLRKVEGGRINFLAFFVLPFTLIQSLWLLFLFMPDLVFSKGGFASVFPSLAAWSYFIPVFIHESDSIPGKANILLSKFSRKVFISFENAAGYFPAPKTILSGNPVRKEIFGGDRSQALNRFGFGPDKKTILFLAGSQGAAFINNLVIDSLVQLVKEFHPVRGREGPQRASASNGVQIIHQAGINNFEQMKKELEQLKREGESSYAADIEKNYRLFGFLSEEELKDAFAASDLIVSRSGSNIFEIAALGKPAIVIPYPYSAGEHQRQNAIEFAKFGAVVLEEQNLKTHILIDQIKNLLKPENYSAVSQQIKSFARVEGGGIIAAEIFEYLNI
ncbi:MAG: UDP-N-acetylglucosamine--N-acetylmuramyl-(pentapeptide) pyrophosphoryl-undecaprenol N-acetylglucosamine transferase [Patescibacteria group bacterium]